MFSNLYLEQKITNSDSRNFIMACNQVVIDHSVEFLLYGVL